MDLQQAAKIHWDVIVIGTGMGGGTAGYALARAGWRVLFVEKGLSRPSLISKALEGFPEAHFPRLQSPGLEHRNLLKEFGREFEPLRDESRSQGTSFFPLIGSGMGGSSALYGAALERFFPKDFTATHHFANVGNSSIVDWPIQYSDLEDCYRKAEELYWVHGSPDPMRLPYQSKNLPSIPWTSVGHELADQFRSKGLHPYRLPVGHKPRNLCQGCQGTLCVENEKADSASVCVMPALSNHGASILDQCEVLRLATEPNRVHSVEVNRLGQRASLHADLFLLAGGALRTPQILLQSRSSSWPTGLGNHSDQVGRNFMRHYMDLHIVLVDLFRQKGPLIEKELAFNDFYFHDSEKLGTVQSLGNFPDPRASICEMHAEESARRPSAHRFYFPLMSWGATLGMKVLFSRSVGFASIMEDLPYADNRVMVSDRVQPKLFFHYELHSNERRRIKKFRKLVSGALRPRLSWLHSQAENNQRLAHACGTCRMGDRAESSVVDSSNKVHGIDNLYIVDASVFPTSSGINPSLTIAALALRAAEKIRQRFEKRVSQ